MKHIFRTAIFACLGLFLGAGQAGAVYHVHSIKAIRTGAVALNDSVEITTCVVVGVDIKTPTYGVYVEDAAGGNNSGILAYAGAVFPRTTDGQTIVVGERIKLQGRYTEFVSGAGSLSEITSPVFTRLSVGAPLVPQNVTVVQIGAGTAAAESLEGLLVKVSNIRVTTKNAFNNWFFHQIPWNPAAVSDSLCGYEKMVAGQVVPQPGDTLTSAVGVLQWENSQRCLAPRNSDDIKFKVLPAPIPNQVWSVAENKIRVHFNVDVTTASAQTTSNYSLSTFETFTSAVYDTATQVVTLTTNTNLVPSTTPHVLTVNSVRNIQNRIMTGPVNLSFVGGISTIVFVQTPKAAGNDTSQVVNRRVTVRGVVTETTGVDFPSSIGGFYLQQRSITAYGALFCFGTPTEPVRGDSVLVAGLITEFGNGPETEMTSIDEIQIISHNRPAMQPVAALVSDVDGTDVAQAEKLEGMLIKLSGVTTDSTRAAGVPFDAISGGNKVRIGDLAINEAGVNAYAGTVYDIIGITRIAASAPFRQVQPRDWREPPKGDIHTVSSPVSGVPSVSYRTQLMQNQPNPFNPTTAIEFTLAREGQTTLRVFDVRGKLVRSLVDGKLTAGPHHVAWDGLNQKGQRADTGIYFYRLLSGGVEQTRKMVLLK